MLRTASWVSQLLALTLGLLLAGCSDREPRVACVDAPAVDGYRTVVAEGGTLRLRLPGWAKIIYTINCEEARDIGLTYVWDDSGRLLNYYGAARRYDSKVEVYLDVSQPSTGQRADNNLPWPDSGNPLRSHGKYPLELVRPAVGPNEWDIWAVHGTLDPTTGHPFTVVCNLERVGSSNSDTSQPPEFPKSNPDARCRGAVRAVRGDKVIFAGVHIWAHNAPYIDHIYRAVQSELSSYIVAD